MCRVGIECPLEGHQHNCPHNPGPQVFAAQLSEAHTGNVSVLVLKPGCFPVDRQGRMVKEETETAILTSGLQLVATSCTQLNTDGVKTLYPDIFGQRVVDKSGQLEIVRQRLLDYLVDQCILSFLVYGDEAVVKTKTIKTIMRAQYGVVNGSTEVQNVIHASERHEITTSLGLLFLSDYHV